jgi:hypothetical protein
MVPVGCLIGDAGYNKDPSQLKASWMRFDAERVLTH